MQDYGRQFFDVRNRVFAFANYSAPWGFRISPFLSAWSSAPFNVQLSQDNNGDSFFNDRPVFATSASNPADVDITKYGNFDISATPPPGAKIIPVNYGNASVQFAMNMRVAKTFGVGPRVEEGQGARVGGGGGRVGGHAGNGAGRQRTKSGWPKHPCGPAIQHHVERLCPQYLQRGQSGAPNGTLGGPPNGTTDSPFFGKATQLATGFFSHGSAVRDFAFQALFNF